MANTDWNISTHSEMWLINVVCDSIILCIEDATAVSLMSLVNTTENPGMVEDASCNRGKEIGEPVVHRQIGSSWNGN